MTDFPIPANDRRSGPFVASAGQTVFPYDFPLFDAADIAVYAQASGASVATKLAGADFTVTDIGEEDGGTIVLATGAAAGTIYSILGARAARRTSDFTDAGELRAETLNRELDLLTQTAQEQSATIGRSLRLAETDTASDTVLPVASARAGLVLGFDASGNLVVRSVGTLALGAGDVTTDKLADGGVTTDKLADGALSADAAGRAKMADGFVTAREESDDPWATAASAATVDLGAINSRNVQITGTTTITSLGNTGGEGRAYRVRFTGALTLTHNAASLILPGAANITTAAGDTAEFVKESGTGNWRCTDYQRASGAAVVASGGWTLATPVAATSGTSIDFTGIPSTARAILISLQGVSTNGSSVLAFRIGSGSVDATGYLGTSVFVSTGTAVNNTTYFGVEDGGSASAVRHGVLMLTLLNSSTNLWSYAGNVSRSDIASSTIASGSKSLSGALDRVRLTTVGGSDTFDAGSINIMYQ